MDYLTETTVVDENAGRSSEDFASNFSEEELKKLGQNVKRDYENDLSGRADWDEARSNWLKLYSMYTEPKDFPWEGCANVLIPTLSTAVIQFQARARKALLGRKQIVHAKYQDAAFKEASVRISKFMNHQLQNQLEDWIDDMDRLLIQLALFGNAFKKTYWDSNLNRPVSKMIPVEDLVVSINAISMETAPRITHVSKISFQELRDLIDKGFYMDSSALQEPLGEPSYDGLLRDALLQSEGRTSTLEENEGLSEVILLEQHFKYSLNNTLRDIIITIEKSTASVLKIEENLVQFPDNSLGKMEFFTKYSFIPNPESFYDIGFGQLLYGLNSIINTTTNQLLDAGTLQNMQSGFYDKRSGLKGGDTRFSQGTYKGVAISGDDIRKAIYTHQFTPPSSTLFQMRNSCIEEAARISTVSDQMTGEMPPSDTAATTTVAVLEQGLTLFSTIQQRIHSSLTKELKKLFIINGLYLDESLYIKAQDALSEEMKSFKSGLFDFKSDVKIVPTSDPNVTSKAEDLTLSKEAYAFGMANPLISNNPEAIYLLTKNILRALGIDNLDEILKKPEPPMPKDTPPEEENANFLKEVSAVLLPQQDHRKHLESHSVFQQSLWSQSLSSQGKNLLKAHLQETLSQLYLQEQQNATGMATGLGNEMLQDNTGAGTLGNQNGSPQG